MRDLITVTDLQLRTPTLQRDLWQRPAKQQPLVCSLSIRTDVAAEADSDSLLSESLNYGTVTKAIEGHVAKLGAPEPAASSDQEEGLPLEVLAEDLAKVILFQANAPNVRLELSRPRALLTAESVGVTITRSRSDYIPPTSPSSSKPLASEYTLRPDTPALHSDFLFIRALRRLIIIGLNPGELVDEQEVIVDLEFGADEMNVRLANGARAGWTGWRKMVRQVESHLSTSAPLTIEHITTSLAKIITAAPPALPSPASWDVPTATVRVSKPSALMFAKYPAVQVTRSRSDFYPTAATLRFLSNSAAPIMHSVILGLGTNIGDRVGHLSDALKKLEELGQGKVRVRDTSFLYESEAMYHEEQAKFLNAAVKIETSLDPLPLLNLLKSVEEALGRDFTTFRNGPRVIDLDILLYDDLVYDSTDGQLEKTDDRWLKVPHQSIKEREFVLRPLSDLAPSLQHPALGSTPTDLLRSLLRSSPSTVHRVLPLSRSFGHAFSRPATPACAPTSNRTLVMSIINTTPDSFSDGGLNASVSSAISSSLSHLSSGADILDIGGMSTRPGASDVSSSEEISRVVPLIRSLRTEQGISAPISIDTFRPEVARAAIEAGADIINDVYGGAEPGMLETMAHLAVPVVLMHSRGDPKSMSNMADYGAEGVVAGVRRELEDRVERALEAGVRRWNIILDPGIGFAKTAAHNYELMRNLDRLFADSPLLKDFPVLVGLSRKRFLGPEIEAKDRVWGTAAGVTASIASGVCEVVRVHDTKEMRHAVAVADAIYRSGEGR
ncbi:hypothetical protein JCM1841_005418 [Sporobolomyces salmonicolor]